MLRQPRRHKPAVSCNFKSMSGHVNRRDRKGAACSRRSRGVGFVGIGQWDIAEDKRDPLWFTDAPRNDDGQLFQLPFVGRILESNGTQSLPFELLGLIANCRLPV